MEKYFIDQIRAKGVTVQSNDGNGLFSVGDELYFNRAIPEHRSELSKVIVTKENLQVLWYLLSKGIKACKDVCRHEVPWISKRDYFSYTVDSRGVLSSVRFFGKCEQFVRPQFVRSEYSADNSLLMPWTPEIDRESKDAPYVRMFGGRLAYVAARHMKGIKSPTFKKVKETIENFKPDIIILEGREDSRGISPVNPAGFYEECEPDFSGCGELMYTLSRAYENGIPVFHGEPIDEDVKKEFLSRRYNEQDLLGYYFLRRHGGQVISGKKEFDEDMDEYRGEARLNIQPSLVFAYEDFLKWYRDKTGKAFDPRNIEDPFDGRIGYFLLKLAQEVSNYRDANITRTIAHYLNRYDRVMVVYGAGHLASQRKVLEKMFE